MSVVPDDAAVSISTLMQYAVSPAGIYRAGVEDQVQVVAMAAPGFSAIRPTWPRGEAQAPAGGCIAVSSQSPSRR